MSSGGLTRPIRNTYPRATFYQMRCKDTIRNGKKQIFPQKDYFLIQILYACFYINPLAMKIILIVDRSEDFIDKVH